MSLSIAIVGPPNVGKSTLFNALTDSQVLAANYPFATIEPNTGVVPVPDSRLQPLADLYKTSRIIPASVTFVDVAGLVKGASEGEGLGNQFLGHIRNTSAIVQVVRAFDDPDVTRAEGSSSPSDDIAVINTELVLADLQTIDRRLPRLVKEAKATPALKAQLDMLEMARQTLDAGTPLFAAADTWKPEDAAWLKRELQLLTLKPIIYVFNVDEHGLQDTARQQELRQLAAPAQALFICAKLEDELRSLDASDRAEMLLSYGQSESGLGQLIRAAYDTLGLQSYLTAGEKEVRAWTISRGSTAPQAAGVIHGDFERGFIATEVVSYGDLLATGSLAAARAAGKVRTEGKTYVMQPDDVVEFRFNVSK
ncbi:MAG TPA: redox-regulated ATPase YchF [Candidatus Saccharimonadales bacterium]